MIVRIGSIQRQEIIYRIQILIIKELMSGWFSKDNNNNIMRHKEYKSEISVNN